MAADIEEILWLPTGGTIDSEPYPDPYHPPQYVKTLKGDDSRLPQTIQNLELRNPAKVKRFEWGKPFNGKVLEEEEFVKDSQLFTEQNMRDLAEVIRSDKEHSTFLITHGTDHMAVNAAMLKRILGDDLKRMGKRVVFAGAMVPLSMHRQLFQGKKIESDGVEALRFAIDNAPDTKSRESGVYIVGFDSGTEFPGFFDPERAMKERDLSLNNLRFTLSGPGVNLGRTLLYAQDYRVFDKTDSIMRRNEIVIRNDSPDSPIAAIDIWLTSSVATGVISPDHFNIIYRKPQHSDIEQQSEQYYEQLRTARLTLPKGSRSYVNQGFPDYRNPEPTYAFLKQSGIKPIKDGPAGHYETYAMTDGEGKVIVDPDPLKIINSLYGQGLLSENVVKAIEDIKTRLVAPPAPSPRLEEVRTQLLRAHGTQL